MIVDTSALLAIVFDEPDSPELLRLVVEAPTRLMSAANRHPATTGIAAWNMGYPVMIL